ncbi:MAG: hypothetical protein IPK16_14465 [Anaerolineales bacterium]|nr:hypothetical protein [Anaerolineales bacterium]
MAKRYRQLWPLLIYALASILMTWPLTARLGLEIPSDTGSDFWVHEWTLWWLKQAIFTGQNPYFTDLLAHPTGVSLTSHNIAWFNFALWFPLEGVIGANAAHSITYLVMFTFNAYAMYLFAYQQTRSWAGALIAGFVFGFFPYTLSGAGHLNLLITGWLPLTLLFLDRMFRTNSLRDMFMAGLSLALVGVSRWQLLAMSVIVVGAFVLYRLAMDRTIWRLRTLGLLAGVGLVMMVLIAPLFVPVAVEQATREYADELLTYEPAFSADLLGYVVPHTRLSVWTALVSQLPQNLQFPQQEVNFLGYTVLALSALAILFRWRKAWFWAALALVLMIFALGPVITIGQQAYPQIPTPYRLVEDFFLNKLIRKPERYDAVLGLPFAMLAAIGVSFLRRRLATAGLAVLLVVLTALILAEYTLVPYRLAMVDTPAWYATLADDPSEFATVDIPISSRLMDKFYMHYQIEHGRPMVGGHVSRPPRESIAYMDESPFLYDMLHQRVMDLAVVDVTHQLQYLADAGVRYAILHKRMAPDEKIDAWMDWLTIEPTHEDDDLAVYNTDPEAGVDYTITLPLTDAIGAIRTGEAPAQAQQTEAFVVDVRWGSQAPVNVDYAGCIRLVDGTRALAQSDCAQISPAWPTSRWQTDEVARQAIPARVGAFLAPGTYTVELALQDLQSGELVGKPAAIGAMEVTALPRTFEQPASPHALDLQLGDEVRLLGYDVRNTDDAILLTLDWQGMRRMERGYKVFVHLVDSATGTIVAQHDAPPQNWAYPTTWWEAGEVVTESIALPFGETKPDDLFLRIGLYDEATGERLAMQGDGALTVEDNALLIPLGGD